MSFVSVSSPRYVQQTSFTKKDRLFDNDLTTCIPLAEVRDRTSDIYFLVPYKVNGYLCRTSFFVTVTLYSPGDTCLLPEGTLDVLVTDEAVESMTEWYNAEGQFDFCTHTDRPEMDSSCTSYYRCSCEDFCTIMIAIDSIQTAYVSEICEINVF